MIFFIFLLMIANQSKNERKRGDTLVVRLLILKKKKVVSVLFVVPNFGFFEGRRGAQTNDVNKAGERKGAERRGGLRNYSRTKRRTSLNKTTKRIASKRRKQI